jgi:hypothetical protein
VNVVWLLGEMSELVFIAFGRSFGSRHDGLLTLPLPGKEWEARNVV